jgi:hypothetical protein
VTSDPRALTREDAQRRVDRIRAFREELAELEGLGVVALDAGQREKLRLFHEEATASLAARFDVDASEAEKRLSLGMRVASFLGATALAAAVSPPPSSSSSTASGEASRPPPRSASSPWHPSSRSR